MGIPITDKQIKELESQASNIDFEAIKGLEKECRHEVMAHIRGFAAQCPNAKGIIHLGATSSYVMDNTVLIQMKQGLKILRKKIHLIIEKMQQFALQYSELPCLSYTHLQPAQPTTVGKRCCSWIQDLLFDLTYIENSEASLKFLGVKGATGTQASFCSLFNNDEGKIRDLELIVTEEMGFKSCYTIATQTYPRKVDMNILSALSGLGASLHKMATDIRLLTHMGEMSEPFEKAQVGSSAMPHKRNPILCERICSLARYLISHYENAAYNASLQWLERTLDDSANRRLTISESFLCADAICNLTYRIVTNLKIFPKIIAKNLNQELPYLTLETLMLIAVEKGHDRQQIHEKLRALATETRIQYLENGISPDLLQKIIDDNDIDINQEEIKKVQVAENFIGRAKDQTLTFIKREVTPRIQSKGDEKVSLDIEV